MQWVQRISRGWHKHEMLTDKLPTAHCNWARYLSAAPVNVTVNSHEMDFIPVLEGEELR